MSLNFGLILPFVTSATAAVRAVPSSYPTIQSAIQAAEDRDVVEIEPGLYLQSSPFRIDPGTNKIRIRASGPSVIIATGASQANDDYGDGTELSGSDVQIKGNNYGAADGPEFPDVEPPARPDDPASDFGAGVWFEWTAPSNGLTVVTVSSDDFEVSMGVFQDFFSFPRHVTNELAWPLEYHNEVAFMAFKNARYSVLVGGRFGGRGRFELNINQGPPPPNDHFTNAMVLIGNSVTIAGSTLFATAELPLEPPHAGVDASHSVWFRWTAPDNNPITPVPVRLTIDGDFNRVVTVYQGSQQGQLEVFMDPATNVVSFFPEPGGTYHFAVDGVRNDPKRSDLAGTYLLQLDHSVVDLRSPWLAKHTPPSIFDPVEFEAQIDVRNRGSVPTGPLRLRTVVRHGSSDYAIKLAKSASEILISDLDLNGGVGLGPDQGTSQIISGTIPGPILYDNRLIKEYWGLFVLLDEQLADSAWITIDRALLTYGPKSQSLRLRGLVPRIVPQVIDSSELNQILGFDIDSLYSIANGFSNRFLLLALLDDGNGSLKERSVEAVSWQAPNWVAPSPDGTFEILSVDHSTNISVSASYHLGGEVRTVQDRVWVYRRPRLELIAASEPRKLQLKIESDFEAQYFLEMTDGSPTNHAPMQWNWELQSDLGILDQFPLQQNLDAISLSNRFFRLRAEPLKPLQP